MAKKMTGPTNARQAKIAAARKDSGAGVSKIIVAAVVVVVAIIAVVGGVVIAQGKKQDRAGTSTAVPAAAGAMGEGFVANKDVTLVAGAPTLDVYEDFQCSHCAEYERVMGRSIAHLAEQGRIKLVYHFKTIMDANNGSNRSLVMANAVLCAGDVGAFARFHRDAFLLTIPRSSADWTSGQLRSLAKSSGIEGRNGDTWDECVDDRRYAAYVESVNSESSREGVNATPLVRLNGKELEFKVVSTPEDLESAVDAATSR